MKTVRKNKLMNDLQRRFSMQECVIHSGMKHDHIVELYDYSENEDEIILLMEFVNHADYFEEKIEQRLTPVKNEEKLQSYALDILEALDYIHSQGVIHCDMKLQNLLVQIPDYQEEFPVVKICDFGLAHLVDP